jgi:hypothetical protein
MHANIAQFQSKKYAKSKTISETVGGKSVPRILDIRLHRPIYSRLYGLADLSVKTAQLPCGENTCYSMTEPSESA